MFDLNPQFPTNQYAKSNHNFNHHPNYRNRFNGVQFRLEPMEEDSGVCSPPLWRNNISPPDSPRDLSPASRAQAIAREQREIMEMVENMPETSYELSLKDIVEQRREFIDETQSMEEGEERSILRSGQTESQRWKKNIKGSHKKGRIIVKNGSMDHNKGLLINMVFPFSIKSKKNTSIKTSSSFGSSTGVKFSPKPELLDKSGGDRSDWWWKKFRGSGDSESLGFTSRSGGESTYSSGSSAAGSLRSNSASEHNRSYGCWCFFSHRKIKS